MKETKGVTVNICHREYQYNVTAREPRTNRRIEESPTSALPLVFLYGSFGLRNVVLAVVEYTRIIAPAAGDSEYRQTEASKPCVIVLQAFSPLLFERWTVKQWDEWINIVEK